MAKFEMTLPDEIIRDFAKIDSGYEQIFGGMTKAGAEVVMKNIKANVPRGFSGSNIMGCLKMTRTYKTPSDDGINTKVGFYGYFTNSNGETEPAPLVCNVVEYGRSHPPFTKHPFLRKSFKKGEITSAMLAKQRSLSGGLLE